MYNRSSNKPHGLSRRKSTLSARGVHLEHIHPETAERDAQAAAAQAFARARRRSATDTALWPPPRDNGPRGDTGNRDERCDNGPTVQRQQSVRFVRSRTPKNTQNYVNIVARAAVNGPENPQTGYSPAGEVKSTSRRAKGATIDAGNTVSAPASCHRIRRSKSMLATPSASMTPRSYTHSPTSPATNRMPLSSLEPPSPDTDENIPPMKAKAPQSTSFLTGAGGRTGLIPRRHGSVSMVSSKDAGVQVLHGNIGHVKSQSAGFPRRNKSIHAERPLRRSMRNTDGDDNILPANRVISKGASLRSRAQRASHGFKHKLKSLLNLGRGDTDEATFPPQHIEASKSHVTDFKSLDSVGDDGSQLGSADEEATLARVGSGIPSLHTISSHQQPRSQQGSLDSLGSGERASDTKSRVTSWTNSDTNTFDTLRSHGAGWIRQRLPIVKEDDAHASSSPTPRKPATVDGQRIYSALMKRIHGRGQHPGKADLKEQSNSGGPMEPEFLLPGGSSEECGSEEPNSPSTIRHVFPGGCSDTSSTGTVQRKMGANVHIVHADSNGSPLRTSTQPRTRTPDPLAGESSRPLSGPRMAEAATTLSSRSSAFFASPTCHLFRTRSPYRRALQDSMRMAPPHAPLASPGFSPWMRSLTSLPIRRPSSCESDVDEKMRYPESVYSDNTAGPASGSRGNDAASESGDATSSPGDHGDATIFLDPPAPALPARRVTSSSSSVEWKRWLSTHVAKLEGPPPPPPPLPPPPPPLPQKTPLLSEAATTNQQQRGKENEAPEPEAFSGSPKLRGARSGWETRESSAAAKGTPPPADECSGERRKTAATQGLPLRGESFPATPTARLVRRRQHQRQGRGTIWGTGAGTLPSPGLAAAVEGIFGKTETNTADAGAGAELDEVVVVAERGQGGRSPGVAVVEAGGRDGDEREYGAMVGGSKGMVDRFLSSRRRRVAGSEEEGGSSESALL
ncbi:hypothetical protein GGS23DRAFT_613036 [Durotheca rogersii]|uniref:uncharacterized protein n=1 Tax=Durotheca rogersii TaxID=419775 RepID=UPI00221F5290|nr:uncharacterized protein GGS23DRAFT_613036 [Durotheca rogersii]KAI5867865.1 hypothetical protein GGS23DRAFT_613036 [Durotheca rogersii]